MSDLALSLRQARPVDAAPLARLYVETWHDTYAALLPHAMLAGMSVELHTARIARAAAKGAVLMAEDRKLGPLGLAGFGAARDRGLGLDGEVYTLYVHPNFQGQGVGRILLHGAFTELARKKFHSCVIWSHASNHACFFYEGLGGVRVAERQVTLGGQEVREAAFGWSRLALERRKLAI